MKERPILFSDEMVRAILSGRKTQTRRVIKTRGPAKNLDKWTERVRALESPYGRIGDRLWVRESWQAWKKFDRLAPRDIPHHPLNYLALTNNKWDSRYRHARFMPRWASRITLEITDVRVQRLQDISCADALAEGIRPTCTQLDIDCSSQSPREGFGSLWDSINAKRGFGWDVNPWVWAISFRRVEK